MTNVEDIIMAVNRLLHEGIQVEGVYSTVHSFKTLDYPFNDMKPIDDLLKIKEGIEALAKENQELKEALGIKQRIVYLTRHSGSETKKDLVRLAALLRKEIVVTELASLPKHNQVVKALDTLRKHTEFTNMISGDKHILISYNGFITSDEYNFIKEGFNVLTKGC